MNKLYILILLLSTVFVTTDAQDIIDEQQIDAWLSAYAVDSTVFNDSLNPEAVQQTTVDSLLGVSDTMSIDTKLSAIHNNMFSKSPDLILAEIDKEDYSRKAKMAARTNPLFLGLMFEYPRRLVSLSLNDEDSTIQALRMEVHRDIAITNVEYFEVHRDELPDIEQMVRVEMNKRIKGVEVAEVETAKLDVVKPEVSNWSFGGDIALQVSQNYISSNWYKGGESSLAGILDATGYANYKTDMVQWDNKAELKLGVNSAGSDSLRMMRVNQDRFRITSKLGVKAFNDFFYTVEGEFSTQFCNSYLPNSNERVTAPFSPIRTYLSAGMDYKYKDIVSVFLAPASYKFIYVSDTTVHSGVDPELNIARKVGIIPGKQTLHQLGGLLKVTFAYTFIDVIKLESNLSFYTNYIGEKKGVEIDWEVTANFLINQYFSARLSLNPRYDTTITLPNNEKPRIQFNELLSIGFNYKL